MKTCKVQFEIQSRFFIKHVEIYGRVKLLTARNLQSTYKALKIESFNKGFA